MANFLDSLRTIFKLSGSQAFPSDSTIDYPTTTESPFIAPCDGYLSIGAVKGDDGTPAYVNVWNNPYASSSGIVETITRDARLCIPCHKGKYVYFSFDGKLDVFKFTKSYSST